MIAALKATELEAKRPKGPGESSYRSSCKSSLNKWIAHCQEVAVEHALMAALYVTTVAIMFKDLQLEGCQHETTTVCSIFSGHVFDSL